VAVVWVRGGGCANPAQLNRDVRQQTIIDHPAPPDRIDGGYMRPEEAIYYRDKLRSARALAFRDAENFEQILFCFERLGLALTGKVLTLGGYRKRIAELAAQSPLAESIPALHRDWHAPFLDLYEHVREARNDAMHQGAVARHLTRHALQLALILEDAIVVNSSKVSEFMIRDPAIAYPWQPLSFIREQMLTNGFSFIPIHYALETAPKWYLISEYAIGVCLRGAVGPDERNKRLAMSVSKAVDEKHLVLKEAITCSPDAEVKDVVSMFSDCPILVVDAPKSDHLLGIVTAFDVM
jgi:hypothetical protein